jgi:5'-nucleotidase (lipoprotein e(P4) family)
LNFYKYTASQKNKCVYISNREVSGLQFTLSILQKLKLPDADTSHMLFLSNDFSKEPRRQVVMKNYDVVLLLGDNLNDFMQVFEEKPIAERLSETDRLKEEWGKKFIVLPNPTYGDWENALYDYSDTLPFDQKLIKLKSLLQGFDKK